KDAAAAVERAMHLAIEGRTGLKSRGILLSELSDKLVEKDVDREVAAAIGELFERCSAIRFEPSFDEEESAELVNRARKLVKALS
ncbi:MAG: hypothetical protein KC731_25815, partial [Myxococcales bacterium]|nr:hypothetical protein [Myxococcales bacterium]